MEIFRYTGVTVTTEGKKDLGAITEYPEFRSSYKKKLVGKWDI